MQPQKYIPNGLVLRYFRTFSALTLVHRGDSPVVEYILDNHVRSFVFLYLLGYVFDCGIANDNNSANILHIYRNYARPTNRGFYFIISAEILKLYAAF